MLRFRATREVRLALLVTSCAVLAACSTRSFPLEAAVEPPRVATPARGSVALRVAGEAENVARIDPHAVGLRVAQRLRDSGLVGEVTIAPTLEASAGARVIEVAVSSSHDLHPVANLARSLAAGFSLLLLQPLLPTVWDLRVELHARVLDADGALLASERQGSRQRFESNHLRPGRAAIAEWHRAAVERAADSLVARLARRPELLRADPPRLGDDAP